MEKKDFVIEVSLLVDLDDLDPDDLNEHGESAHDGSYLVTLDWPEGWSLGDLMGRSLEVFHEQHEIMEPSDFNILCRPRNKFDQDADFIVLGEFEAKPGVSDDPQP